MRKGVVGCGAVAAVLVLLLLVGGCSIAGVYNRLVGLNEAVEAQWGQVENTYQRRADLIPNLVATVRGAAEFERETFTQVTEARAKVGQVQAELGPEAVNDPAAFQRFQQAQGELSSALSRLLVVVERYPELRATEAFRDLQAQLEGTENRIAVERRRFNETARDFNTFRNRFPAVFLADFFGDRFRVKPYFEADEGSEEPPKVEF